MEARNLLDIVLDGVSLGGSVAVTVAGIALIPRSLRARRR
jgi:hypothetical protein